MKLYYPITVDLYKPYPLPLVEAQQNNIGRGVLVTLTAQGAVITPTGESIQLYAKKPDGKISYLPCTLTGSQVECDFTNQMLALPGMVQIELQMIGGTSGNETEITTPIFCVQVNPSNVDDSAIESQDEFPALVTALAEVAELKANGLKGDPGEAATIQVGDVTASDPGSDPQVSNSGTEQDAIFDFVLPRGQQGPQGPPGEGVTFGAYSSFPNPGQENVLYVDNTVNPMRAYVWNGKKYVPAGGAAADVSYDNESSGLTAQTVQEAIDENAQNISSLNSRGALTALYSTPKAITNPAEQVALSGSIGNFRRLIFFFGYANTGSASTPIEILVELFKTGFAATYSFANAQRNCWGQATYINDNTVSLIGADNQYTPYLLAVYGVS